MLDQWLRASQSIPLNIAEGNGKTVEADRKRYFEIARGWVLESAAIQDVLVVGKGLEEKKSWAEGGITVNGRFPCACRFDRSRVYRIAMEDRIVIDPAVCNGRPVVRGTRIAVQTVLEFLGAGDSFEDVLEEYPTLTKEDILACIR